MRFAAVMGTLDEVEVLRANVEHLRRIGVELIMVLEYGSTDGSLEYLETAGRNGDIWVLHVPLEDDFDAWAGIELKIARACGAEWVLFHDSDEFWLPASGHLSAMTELELADVLVVERYNLANGLIESADASLPAKASYDDIWLHVRGPDEYEDGTERLAAYLERNPDEAWIRSGGREPKVMVRPEAVSRLHDGDHGVETNADREWRQLTARELLIAHVPFTTVDRFERKVANIRKSVEQHPEWYSQDRAWQWRRWVSVADRGQLEHEFERQFIGSDRLAELRADGSVQSVAHIYANRGFSGHDARFAIEAEGSHQGPDDTTDGGPFVVTHDVRESAENGAEVLARALSESGPASLVVRKLMRDWWSAAMVAMPASSPGRNPFDLRPSRFAVDALGHWQFTHSAVTTMWPIPVDVLALRAVLELVRMVGPSGMPGVSGGSTVREAADGLMGVVDLRLDDATVALWMALEADLEIRTRDDPRGREEIRQQLREAIDAPILEMMSPERQIHELKRMIATAERKAGEVVDRAATYQRQLEDAQHQKNRALSENRDLRARLANTAAALAERDDRVARLTERAQRAEAALGADRRPPAGGRPQRGLRSLRQLSTKVSRVGPFRDLAVNPLFDGDWYAATYLGRRMRAREAYRDYRLAGIAAGRDPNPYFDTDWYLEQYPDVASSRLNPLDHYLEFGGFEGRDPSPHFSSRWYLDTYPDVRVVGINPLLHFLRYGKAEKRLPKPGA